jgi:prophage DNA circulation protein
MVSFDPSLPKPYSEDWRENYGFRYNDEDKKHYYEKIQDSLLTTYQAPEGTPVPFVLDSVRLSGGQSVDTAEYPFFGLWSSTPLNEKPQAITVSGFIRGDTYIKNRNALIEALRVKTDDETPGFLDLPLWGRFPVVVLNYEVEEKGKESGQCSVSITLTRAGVTVEERWKFEGGFEGKTALARGALAEKAIEQFNKDLKDNIDPAAMVSAFDRFTKNLIGIIGRAQGVVSHLNAMTNEVVGITNLIAQGIRSPRELAQALFSAADSIVTGIMEIKNSADDTASYFRDNFKNILSQFLSKSNYSLDTEAATVKQTITREASENLYRTMSLCAAAQIFVQLESPTYQQAKNYWALYEKLEASVDQSNPAIYRAVQNMRIAAVRELAARNLDTELVKHIAVPVPLLYLAHYLGCDNEKLRQLNKPADSFVMSGEVIYV